MNPIAAPTSPDPAPSASVAAPATPSAKPELVVAASAGQARLFLRASAHEPLVPLATLEYAEARRHGSAREQAAGHAVSDHHSGGVALTPRMDPKRKRHIEFARRVSHRIDEELARSSCTRVLVFAACPFVGVLEGQLAPAARKVTQTVDVDLTAFDVAEVGRRVTQALGGPPGA